MIYTYILIKKYKGTQWFGITNELKKYILNYINENEKYLRAFEPSYCSDEVFFHTIIFNSKFKENIYDYNKKMNSNTSNICFNALRYIDWRSGAEYPRILDESDFNKIKDSNCLFGRKFDENLNLLLYENEFNISN